MALPMEERERNAIGYLFCSLPTLHMQKGNKKAQEIKWYVHMLANTINVWVSAKILWSIFQIQGLSNIQNVSRSVFYS